MVIEKETFKKAYVKIRDAIFYGSMRPQDYLWTMIEMDGRLNLWPVSEKRVKIYSSI